MQKVIHYPEDPNFKGSITVEGVFFYTKDVQPATEGRVVEKLKTLNCHNPGLRVVYFGKDEILLDISSDNFRKPMPGNRAYEISGDMDGKVFPEIRYSYAIASPEDIKKNMWSILMANPGSIVKTVFEDKNLFMYLG